jgi:hypothetical protein
MSSRPATIPSAARQSSSPLDRNPGPRANPISLMSSVKIAIFCPRKSRQSAQNSTN